MTATFAPTQASGFAAPSALNGLELSPAKPLLRGRLHQLCALASLPLGARLVADAGSGQRAAALTYAATWTAMFATSAAYHRLAHSDTARRRMRRADHSMIFVHIGGTATSLGLLSLAPLTALVILAAVWSGVAGGVGLKLTRLADGGSAGSWMYAVLGSTQALAMPLISASLTAGQLALLIASGVAYGVGAVLFFRKRLDLFPSVFGYHEVWHCFTLVGGLCQYLLIAQLVQA
jgi:hemolysin III